MNNRGAKSTRKPISAFDPSGLQSKRRSGPTPQQVVDRINGQTGCRRALRGRADRPRGRRGRPVFQEPVLGAANGERRNCLGVRRVLSKVP